MVNRINVGFIKHLSITSKHYVITLPNSSVRHSGTVNKVSFNALNGGPDVGSHDDEKFHKK